MRTLIRDLVMAAAGQPPPPAMTVDNLYAYLDLLRLRAEVDGPVVEVGCAAGGTTVLACRFLSRIQSAKDYYCIDTFGGFVPEHLEADHRLGLTRRHDRLFKQNSKQRVARTLARAGIRNRVHLVEGDICALDDRRLPDQVSVALVDVDLRVPVREGLRRLFPRLAPGGVIVVDDCKAETSWVGADVGYRDFVDEAGLPPRYFLGFGVVERPAEDVPPLPWDTADKPNAAGQNYYA